MFTDDENHTFKIQVLVIEPSKAVIRYKGCTIGKITIFRQLKEILVRDQPMVVIDDINENNHNLPTFVDRWIGQSSVADAVHLTTQGRFKNQTHQ